MHLSAWGFWLSLQLTARVAQCLDGIFIHFKMQPTKRFTGGKRKEKKKLRDTDIFLTTLRQVMYKELTNTWIDSDFEFTSLVWSGEAGCVEGSTVPSHVFTTYLQMYNGVHGVPKSSALCTGHQESPSVYHQLADRAATFHFGAYQLCVNSEMWSNTVLRENVLVVPLRSPPEL